MDQDGNSRNEIGSGGSAGSKTQIDAGSYVAQVARVVWRTFAGIRASRMLIMLVLLTIPLSLVVGESRAREMAAVVMVLSLFARRMYLPGDLRMSVWKAALIIAWFSITPIFSTLASSPGDPYETPGERGEGRFKFILYKRATNPRVEVPNALTADMHAGDHLMLRPAHARGHAGGYVMMLEGEATVHVAKGADHLAVVAANKLGTMAVLKEGVYEVRQHTAGNELVVKRVSGDSAVAVYGSARVVE